MNSKKKINKKTQKRKISLKTQKGRGLFSIDIKSYKNLRYKENGFTLPELICPVENCNGKLFKKRILWNLFFSFVCVSCGHTQFYGLGTKYKSSKS
jgi:hypothetical protein